MTEFDAFDTPETYPWGVAVYAQQNQNPGGPNPEGGATPQGSHPLIPEWPEIWRRLWPCGVKQWVEEPD